MICPRCQSETNVIDSRAHAGTVRRRRECIACESRFTTFEVMAQGLGSHPDTLIILDKRDFSDAIRVALEQALNESLLKSRPLIEADAKKPAG